MKNHFRRKIPSGKEYSARLDRELKLIEQFKFKDVFLQVREILDLVPDYRFITRGSAGCSLVAYLLGLHNMNPIENNFVLSRFMHEFRPDLPDIDVDFAYNQRDIVLEKVRNKYPNRVARISNHVTYQANSAIRQAIRETGNHRFIPKYYDLESVTNKKDEILLRSQELIGTVKNYSLHCGGIVIFPDKIPDELKLNENQIILNKDQVEENGLFKIDLLCNRGLAQLNDLSTKSLEEYPETDELTSKMFCSGNSWGVTFAESPAQRQLHRKIQPKSRNDIIFSLALIRPLPSADGRKIKALEKFQQNKSILVYDDDGIIFIQNLLNCSESEAELYRKAFCKRNQTKIDEFEQRISHIPFKDEIMKELSYFALYSFCRAHATSYGNLVWALGYEKVRQPHKFWCSVLNHAQSLYRPWVHVQQAKLSGLKFARFGKAPWKLIDNELHPCYPEPSEDGWHQFRKRGYWISNRFMPGMFMEIVDNSVKFRGLIATCRYHKAGSKDITFVTIGTNKGLFDLILDGMPPIDKYDVVEGVGQINQNAILVQHFNCSKIEKREFQKKLF